MPPNIEVKLLKVETEKSSVCMWRCRALERDQLLADLLWMTVAAV